MSGNDKQERPAAAQEAVYEISHVSPMNFGGFCAQTITPTKLERGTKLYAAPVAAAPVDDFKGVAERAVLAFARVAQELGIDPAGGADAALAAIAKLRTPAAPGIDLEHFHRAVQRICIKFDGDLPYISGIAEVLRLIDASPKGVMCGVDNVTRAAFQRWAVSQGLSVQRSDFHVGMAGDYVVRETILAWEAWQAALRAAPEGFVLVPVEPTQAMIDAAWKYGDGNEAPDPVYAYLAMLAARPPAGVKDAT